jgi:cellulose synthase (UDP-forming)
MIYHTIVLPINDKLNCVFFCGTAGALRRSAFDEVGGWNTKSITEDSELSVKLLMNGYKSVYLEHETASEVPDTFESFLKQQMRWCYGNARVFFDNAGKIIFSKMLTIQQKIIILFVTLSNASAIVVILMTIFGFMGWFFGEIKLFTLSDFLDFWFRILITGGFLVTGLVTLYKRKRVNEFGELILSVFTMGIVLSFSNAIAFTKAVFNKKLHWFCTAKVANVDVMENGSS